MEDALEEQVHLVWQSSAEPTVDFWLIPAPTANPDLNFIFGPPPCINFGPGVHPSSPAPPEIQQWKSAVTPMNVTVTQ